MNMYKWQFCFSHFGHLFTHKEVQMTPVTIGYKTIDSFNEKCIWRNGFSKVSNHILSTMGYTH